MGNQTNGKLKAASGALTRRTAVSMGLAAGVAAASGTVAGAQPEGSVDPKDLADTEAIKQLKARYFRLMDTRQWTKWGECFTTDCHMRVETEPGVIGTELRGREAIVGGVSKALAGSRTVHHGHMPEVEILGPTTARGVWAMYDYVSWSPARELKGYGHYHETYRKTSGQWQIASLLLTRLRVDTTGLR